MSLHRTPLRLAARHRSSSPSQPTESYVVGEPKEGIIFGAFISKRGKSDSLIPSRVDDFETILNRRSRALHLFFARGDSWPISQQDTVCSGTGRMAMCTWQPGDQGSKITINGSPTGGTFTLSYNAGSGAQTTTNIPYNASASVVQSSLEALSNINTGDVTVTGSDGGPYTVGLAQNHTSTTFTANSSGLTGGTSPSITITRIGTLASINNGYYDAYLRTRASVCAAKGYDILFRPMHEMNGNWESWSASFTGIPSGTQTASDYIQAWKRIWDIFHGLRGGTNCTNVAFVWCPNLSDIPNSSGNHANEYYPGDDYVDWVGADGYNWGALSTSETSISSANASNWDEGSSRSFSTFYSMFPNKPIMWGEIGSADDTQSSTLNKPNWLATLQSGAKNYPRLKAIMWFHAAKERNWQIHSNALTTVTGPAKDVTTITVNSNVATATVSGTHSFTTGQTIYLISVDTNDDIVEYGGAHTITSVTSSTFSFSLTHANATVTNVGGTASLNNWPSSSSTGSTAIAARTLVNDPFYLARPADSITFRNRLGTQTSSNSTSVNVTTGYAVPSGYSIFVVAYFQTSIPSNITITDISDNTYSIDSSVINTGNGLLVIASSHNVAALPSGSNILISSNNTQLVVSAAVLSFDGLATSNTFDQQTGQIVTNGTSWSSGNTSSTTNTKELAIGAFVVNNNNGDFVTATNTYWDQVANVPAVNGATSSQMHVFYRILNATGIQNVSGTITSANAGVAAIATYKGS